MWKLLLALLFLAAPVFAQVHPTAYEAMRTVGVQLNREYVNHVISVTGTDGNPQPETWKILIDDPKARGGVREIEVDEGKISSERTPLRSSVEGSLGKTIDTGKLNLDSSGAFTLAQQTAQKSHINFARADYTLRSDERGNPIWMIALTRQNGEAAGRIFIGANHGTVVRTEGLFVGSDQVAMAGEQNGKAGDDDDGETNPVKRTFRQVSDDVKRTFNNVSRSFVDFWKDK
jgi:hypothetical protein